MKKVIFLVAALMAVFSGIAAVSAYEGHQIDVKAHVENALMVSDYDVDYGITFPQEKKEAFLSVGLSESFRAQKYYSSVDYRLFWEPKAVGQHTVVLDDPDNDGFFIPIYPFIYTQVDGLDTKVVTTSNPKIMEIVKDPAGNIWALNTSGDECDEIHLSFTPPVFAGWYNAATDAIIGKTGVVLPAKYFVVTEETAKCGFKAMVPKTDLGSNLKIQVSDIFGD